MLTGTRGLFGLAPVFLVESFSLVNNVDSALFSAHGRNKQKEANSQYFSLQFTASPLLEHSVLAVYCSSSTFLFVLIQIHLLASSQYTSKFHGTWELSFAQPWATASTVSDYFIPYRSSLAYSIYPAWSLESPQAFT